MLYLIYSVELILTKLLNLNSVLKKILILGDNETANALINDFRGQVGGIRTVSIPSEGNDEPLTTTRKIGLAVKTIEAHRKNSNGSSAISEVWITHDVYSQVDQVDLERKFYGSAVRVVYIADLPMVPNAEVSFVGGYATINSDIQSPKRLRNAINDLIGRIISTLLIILLLPLLLLIAIGIKFDSRGPVLYFQKRFGVNGSEFDIIKFRTMNVIESTSNFVQASKGDSRITPVGRILRRTSLDELPQLLNVIAGDMALIGPRPHPNLLDEKFRYKLDGYMQRYNIKPGITGLAQIRGFRGETKSSDDMKLRVQADLEYIQTKNPILDLKIILCTIKQIFSSDSAY